jgi:hypothetical protein
MHPRVIFVGGVSRSGTTLLHRLLGQLPDVVSLGEVCNLWGTGLRNGDLCTCGDLIASCVFWKEIGDRAFGGWDAVDLQEMRRLRGSIDRIRFLPALLQGKRSGAVQTTAAAYASYYTKIYTAALEVGGAQVVVDSSKRAPLACCLGMYADVDLKLVHIVRDSRGVAYSCTKNVLRVDSVRGATLGTASPADTSLNWIVQNLALEILSRKGVSTRMLTYERLIEDPVGVLREVISFAGLSVDESAMRFLSDDHAVLDAGHSIGGNPMRAQTGRVSLRLDDAWRTHLPRTDRLLVSALTFPLLRRYSRS